MSTKSTRSSGTQHNARGVTQGNTLVDPVSGLPITVITDANGKKRLAVDANVTANISGVEVSLDGVGPTGDNVSIVDNVTGNKLKVEADGSINTNTEVDAGDGDNIGLQVQERNLTPDDTKYNKRVTATTGTTDTDTTSMDVAIHDHQGNQYTDRNPIPVSNNYEKILDVILKSSWLKLAVYDEVITTVSPDRATINVSFKEDGFVIGEAIVNYISDINWNFNLYRYLLDDDGSQLLDDDDTPLILE